MQLALNGKGEMCLLKPFTITEIATANSELQTLFALRASPFVVRLAADSFVLMNQVFQYLLHLHAYF